MYLCFAAFMGFAAFSISNTDYASSASVEDLRRIAVIAFSFIGFRWVVDAIKYAGLLSWVERNIFPDT